MNYAYVGKHFFAHLGNLNLQPGRFYRTSLKLCVENLCFPPVKSNGFIVLHSYPKIGTLFINIGEQQVYWVFRYFGNCYLYLKYFLDIMFNILVYCDSYFQRRMAIVPYFSKLSKGTSYKFVLHDIAYFIYKFSE